MSDIILRERSREFVLEQENVLLRCIISCILSGRVAFKQHTNCHFVIDSHIKNVMPAIVERNPTGCFNIFHEWQQAEQHQHLLLPAAEPHPVPPEQTTKTN